MSLASGTLSVGQEGPLGGQAKGLQPVGSERDRPAVQLCCPVVSPSRSPGCAAHLAGCEPLATEADLAFCIWTALRDRPHQ